MTALALDPLARITAERDALRRFLDAAVDVELRSGVWLEKHGQRWSVHQGTRTLASGADLETAMRIAMEAGR